MMWYFNWIVNRSACLWTTQNSKDNMRAWYLFVMMFIALNLFSQSQMIKPMANGGKGNSLCSSFLFWYLFASSCEWLSHTFSLSSNCAHLLFQPRIALLRKRGELYRLHVIFWIHCSIHLFDKSALVLSLKAEIFSQNEFKFVFSLRLSWGKSSCMLSSILPRWI